MLKERCTQDIDLKMAKALLRRMEKIAAKAMAREHLLKNLLITTLPFARQCSNASMPIQMSQAVFLTHTNSFVSKTTSPSKPSLTWFQSSSLPPNGPKLSVASKPPKGNPSSSYHNFRATKNIEPSSVCSTPIANRSDCTDSDPAQILVEVLPKFIDWHTLVTFTSLRTMQWTSFAELIHYINNTSVAHQPEDEEEEDLASSGDDRNDFADLSPHLCMEKVLKDTKRKKVGRSRLHVSSDQNHNEEDNQNEENV